MAPATAASRFPGGSAVEKNPPANEGDVGSIPGSEDPLEKEIATHSTYSCLRNPNQILLEKVCKQSEEALQALEETIQKLSAAG